MKNKLLIIIIFASLLPLAVSASTLAEDLKGRILLQVESHGEAWYVYPADFKKYYLGRPDDAFAIMRKLGIGITNADLNKIDADLNFAKQNSGKIFLQIESKGEAWYVNPKDRKKYFLGRPSDAFDIMRKLGLGISNQNINLINTGVLQSTSSPTVKEETFYTIAGIIRSGNNAAIKACFTSEIRPLIANTMNSLDNKGKFTLGNIMAGAKLSSSTENEKIYSTTIYFAGYTKTLNFHLKKQPDGKWLMTNL